MRIQRAVRNFINNNRRTISTFILCPYDKDLDLNDKNDFKLYESACARLKEADRFDGSLEKAGTFLKLFGKHISDCRLKRLLEIAVEWDSTGTNSKIPVKTIKLFEANKATKKQIKKHCELVWSDTNFASTDEWYKDFGTSVTNNATLTKMRQATRLKHMIFGKALWNSMTSDF